MIWLVWIQSTTEVYLEGSNGRSAFWSRQEVWQFAEDGNVHDLSSQGIKYDRYEQHRTWSDLNESHLPRARYFQVVFLRLRLGALDLTSTFRLSIGLLILFALLHPDQSYLGLKVPRQLYPLTPFPLIISILPQFPFTFSYNFCLISSRCHTRRAINVI